MNQIIITKDPDGFLVTLPTGVVHQADDDVEAKKIAARWVKHHGETAVVWKGKAGGTSRKGQHQSVEEADRFARGER